MIELQTAWGWQVALYLFLGGLGAGMFIAAALLSFVRHKRHRQAVAISCWIAAACVAVGLALLLVEVIHPGRALLMWQSFSHLTSWMALGAWGALAALAVFLATAVLMTKRTSNLLAAVWEAHPGLRRKLRTACLLVGLAPALFMVFYTGMLLRAASGVPFWNSWLLPCLFVVSALGAGVNAVAALAVFTESAGRISRKRRRLIAGIVIVIVAIESLLILLYLTNMLQGGSGTSSTQQFAAMTSAAMLVFGACSLPFWGLVVLGGLVVPLATSVSSLFLKSRAGCRMLVVGALFTLVGDCALRVLFLHVGMGADYVGQALLSIL